MKTLITLAAIVASALSFNASATEYDLIDSVSLLSCATSAIALMEVEEDVALKSALGAGSDKLLSILAEVYKENDYKRGGKEFDESLALARGAVKDPEAKAFLEKELVTDNLLGGKVQSCIDIMTAK